MQVNFDNTKFKLDSMLSQQAKLIDYLQVKVENPGKKKKVSLVLTCYLTKENPEYLSRLTQPSSEDWLQYRHVIAGSSMIQMIFSSDLLKYVIL